MTLSRIAGLIAESGVSIIEVAHDRAFCIDINTVNVHCIVETRDAEHIGVLKQRLQQEGFLAKSANDSA